MIQFDSYFSTGLVQPPTRNPCFLGMKTQAPPEKNRQAEAEAAEDLAARLAATEGITKARTLACCGGIGQGG